MTRILWEGIADTCPCRICKSGPYVYVQFLHADGTGAVWPQPADGRFRDDRTARLRALETAVVQLADERRLRRR